MCFNIWLLYLCVEYGPSIYLESRSSRLENIAMVTLLAWFCPAHPEEPLPHTHLFWMLGSFENWFNETCAPGCLFGCRDYERNSGRPPRMDEFHIWSSTSFLSQTRLKKCQCISNVSNKSMMYPHCTEHICIYIYIYVICHVHNLHIIDIFSRLV